MSPEDKLLLFMLGATLLVSLLINLIGIPAITPLEQIGGGGASRT
jgi:hypothetical protein